jgi:gliding motility-associated-like protein
MAKYFKIFFLLSIIFCLKMQYLSAQNSFQRMFEADNIVWRNPKISANGAFHYLQGTSVTNNIRQTYLCQLDKKGVPQWAKKLGNDNIATNNNDILPTANGLLATFGEDDQQGTANAFVVKFDNDGKVVWNTQVGDKMRGAAPVICEDAKGNIWFAYEVATIQNDFETIFGKMNSGGKIISLSKFSNSSSIRIFSLSWHGETNQICFLGQVADNGLPRSIFGTIDNNGDLVWVKKGNGFRFQKLLLQGQRILLYSVKTTTQLTDIFSIHHVTNGNTLITKALENVEDIDCNDKNCVVQYSDAQIITQYDSDFQSVWSRAFPTCTSQDFVEIGINDQNDCLIWKRINDKILITKPTIDGKMEVCEYLNRSAPSMIDAPARNFTDAKLDIIKTTLPLPNFTNVIAHQVWTSVKNNPFCPTLPDATFTSPDSVCSHTAFMAIAPKNTAATRLWLFDQQPMGIADTITITTQKNGHFEIKHIVSTSVCSDTVKKIVKILAAPKIIFQDTTFCNKTTINFDFSTPNATQYWLNNNLLNNPVQPITKAGNYALRMANKYCESKKNIQFSFTKTPTITFKIDSIYCQNIPFEAKIDSFTSIFWNGKATNTFIIRDNLPHRYEAFLNTCKVEGSLTIPRKNCEAVFFLPTIFSPNGDNINDEFQAYGDKIKVLDLKIFDRWGDLIFTTQNPPFTWSGNYQNTAAAEGVYLFILQYWDETTQTEQQKIGNITLLR